ITPKIPAQKMRETLKLPDQGLILGSIAGDKPVKGVEYLIRAFANLKANARLVLVGARWERWKDLHKELGLNDKVIYAGRVECVADYLQLFDVFALPSLSESMPNALLEAVSFGLPVVATAVGGVPELVRDNGLLIPAKDAPALETALLQLCSDENIRKKFAQASRELAGKFTMENKVNQTVELYTRLLDQRGFKG
ncbi:MAG: glycosyltransferase family 4 protein, partial [Thermodesulfobacteriota bacterium]|nr:glycosyltransferase family 4 protein [Thermodesulfobacteriota bacterium]